MIEGELESLLANGDYVENTEEEEEEEEEDRASREGPQ